jgi:hypothetical protein
MLDCCDILSLTFNRPDQRRRVAEGIARVMNAMADTESMGASTRTDKSPA